MDYRFENREFEARLELPVHIAIVVELRLHEELANYASASFLRETGVFLLQSHRYVEGQALTAERRHNCDNLCTLFSRIHTYVYPYTLYSILYLVGDDPSSAQALVELVWEYSAQMEARQLTNAFEYVARCRHWKQLQRDVQQAIQSEGPHLPVHLPGSSGVRLPGTTPTSMRMSTQ